ncbi:MAG: hypothetical protein R6T99_03015 [Bacteroidales bacterium]
MMKRIVLVIFVCMLFGVAQTQNSNNEVYMSYGAGTVPGIIDGFTNVLSDFFEGMFVDAKVIETKSLSSGAIGLGYNRDLSKKITIGVVFLYQGFDVDTKIKLKDGSIMDLESNDLYYTGMARVNFRYVQTRWVTLYSGLAAGMTINIFDADDKTSADDQDIQLAYQINGVGIRVGKTYGAFAELGFGYSGFISGGLSWKF